MPRTPALMLQGTSSHAGKSLIVAGLCRAYARRGLRVRPFKPQNMSNNAAVTPDGHEIGRAQALQARACGVPPSRHMNPVLLKPETDSVAQVVLQGRAWRRCGARDYHRLKPELLPMVLASFGELEREADLILCEGAGSPAEVNLRAGDIANMGFARAAQVPVVLLGDIERGGVIAQLVGTVALFEADERALLRGYVVNKFRGDPTLFDGAHAVITARTGLTNLGVVPWFEPARNLPREDALGLEEIATPARAGAEVRIVVPRLPRIANFDDLDPLASEPRVRLTVLEPGEPVPADADLVLLPGSKATIADLAALRRCGWDIDIRAHVRRGGFVVGLCGGYQMLGRSVADPHGVEGPPGRAEGLGLLPVDTVLGPVKTVREARATHRASGEPVSGYEIHLGETVADPGTPPMLDLGGRPEGAVGGDGRVMGCYLHGIFASDGFRRALLRTIGLREPSRRAYEREVEATLDGLAAHLERWLDLDRLLAMARARA